jgi:pimeloyl-ACP methyl ester carboxylesterase
MLDTTAHSTMRTTHVGDRVDGGTYVDVDGVPTWHFVDGNPSGPPTVLLHGAFAAASTWGAQIPDFVTSGLHVHIPERSGHGHSPDVPGPFTYDHMAQALISYLESVVGGPAHLVGWSDGAVIALQVAHRRPDLVTRLVLVGQYFNRSGQDADEFFRLVRSRDKQTLETLRSDYVVSSPDGADHFETVFDKTMTLIEAEPDYDLRRFAEIGSPTLVVQGDRDVVRLEHSIDVVRALHNARLAVLPGTHILPIEAPELFNPLVLSFLAADPPRSWRP